jgi:PAS domain S-box-containing protein
MPCANERRTSGWCSCNAAFLRMLGIEREEHAIGKELHDTFHHTHPDGSHYPKEECPIYRTARGGDSAHVDNELFFRLDGSSLWVEYWVSGILRGEKLQGAVCTFVDVTEAGVCKSCRAYWCGS